MVDPITPAVYVPWRGKTYAVQMTLGAIAGASRDIGVDLLAGAAATLPATTRGPITIFAALRRVIPALTLDEVEDEFFATPEAMERFSLAVEQLDQQLAPLYAKFAPKKGGNEDESPLAEMPSGATSGAPESSS